MLVYVVGARGIPGVEGGAEKNAECVFPRLVARGYEVTLFGLREHIQTESHGGVLLKSAPPSKRFGTDKLAMYCYAVKEAWKERPDIVHIQSLGAALFILPFKLARLRVVARYGSTDYLYGKWGWLGNTACKFGEWQLRFADAVIAVSPAMQSHLLTRGIKSDVHLIGNGRDALPDMVDVPLPKNIREAVDNAALVVTVGRITTAKNLEVLIEAVKAANESRPVKLLVVGGVDDESYYQSLCEISDDSIIYAGRLDRDVVFNLLQKCAVYVNCSRFEGLSNAVLEAVSADSPILLSSIAPNVGVGLAEHHYFGEDDSALLSEKLLESIDTPELYRPVGVDVPDWDEVVSLTEALYRRVNG